MPTRPEPRHLAARLTADFAEARRRTAQIFALVPAEFHRERPIALRHPLIFYAGHLDAFNFNTLLGPLLGLPSFAPALDRLFERGIDPADEQAARRQSISSWPDPEVLAAYKDHVTSLLSQALEQPGTFDKSPYLRGGRMFYLLLEHELMHQETLLYLIHQLPHDQKRPPPGVPLDLLDGGEDQAPAPAPATVEVPAGSAVLGADPGEADFGWDNEFPRHQVPVPRFSIDVHNVTNGQFLDFIAAGGYLRRELWDDAAWARRQGGSDAAGPGGEPAAQHPPFWRLHRGEWLLRGLFSDRPLPRWFPVYVTHEEARAYARFVGKRLPSEAQWHRAAFGDPPGPGLRPPRYPWGDDPPDSRHGNFDFTRWSCTRVGASPAGASGYGVHDLCGNGWEWTDTVFSPFPGFVPYPPYPGYSADFFDGQHFVMKGGCCFTASRLLRGSFRNWFWGYYPHMYASFRCVSTPSTNEP